MEEHSAQILLIKRFAFAAWNLEDFTQVEQSVKERLPVVTDIAPCIIGLLRVRLTFFNRRELCNGIVFR